MNPEHLPVFRADHAVDQLGRGMITIRPRCAVASLSAPQLAALRHLLKTGGSMQEVFFVTVEADDVPDCGMIPSIAGSYEILEDGVSFTPHFPWEPGVCYRATIRWESLAPHNVIEPLLLRFAIPARPLSASAKVQQIYPSADRLPENLLRFYVVFSQPMQRGGVAEHVALLGPDYAPAKDVLYRAPVELWDRSMRVLTILLDPGRLKRGVGPNRELGSPLTAGRIYTLVIGAGLLDGSGRNLEAPVHKSFSVSPAIREAIVPEQWELRAPPADTRLPLALHFPAPLDWALLHSTLTVTTADGQPLKGQSNLDKGESRWMFTPTSQWSGGRYTLAVHTDLEDLCGNSPLAPFDRPLRLGLDLLYETQTREIYFTIEAK